MVVTSSAKQFVLELSNQMLLARSLGLVAELAIADIIAEAPAGAEELARRTESDADSLYRVLRALAGHGFFAEDEDGCFHLTPSAEILLSQHPDSVRDVLCLDWQNIYWDTYRALPDAVRTGQVAFDRAFGQGFFDYLKANPELNDVFDGRMAKVSLAENKKIVEAYPFDDVGTLIDVGGGRGGLIAAILESHPGIQAALFEQAQVLADPDDLRRANLAGKVELIAGDFFVEIPVGLDVYTLKRIVHDWDDERAAIILRACRAAMADDSRLLVIDALMKPGNEPDPNKDMDLNIMALTCGRERTEAEFRALLGNSGLQLVRIFDTDPPATLSILEARRSIDR